MYWIAEEKWNGFSLRFIFICSCITVHYLLFQIHWPSTAVKTEECIMKGKDAVSIIHCKLNKSSIYSHGQWRRTESLTFYLLLKRIYAIHFKNKYLSLYISIYLYIDIYIYISIYMHTHTCIYTHVYTCTYDIYMYIFYIYNYLKINFSVEVE